MRKLFMLSILVSCVAVTVGCSEKAPAPSKAPSAPPAAAPQAGAPGSAPSQSLDQHPPIEKTAVDAAAPKAGSISKAGQGTVAEIHTKKAEFSGKKVSFRGKVMKFSPMIMGKNWLHIQDGTGDATAGTNDITVTSAQTASEIGRAHV